MQSRRARRDDALDARVQVCSQSDVDGPPLQIRDRAARLLDDHFGRSKVPDALDVARPRQPRKQVAAAAREQGVLRLAVEAHRPKLSGARLPNGDLAGGSVILGMRAGLDLYANVRPIKLYEGVPHKVHGKFTQIWEPGMVDMTVLRENTEGLYHSLLRRSADRALGREEYTPPEMTFPGLEGEVAYDPRPISSKGTERLVRMGFEIAQTRNGAPSDGVSRVSCIDKSNVTRGCQLFRKVFDNVATSYPSIGTDHGYIDAFMQWLTRTPEYYDVVVLSNMFGDIATDLGAVLQGGMGMAASGNVGDHHAFFEPVHGSAPKHAGQNKVNPIASINSIQMMLDWLGRKNGEEGLVQVAQLIDDSVAEHLRDGKSLTYDLGGTATCSDVGQSISNILSSKLSEL